MPVMLEIGEHSLSVSDSVVAPTGVGGGGTGRLGAAFTGIGGGGGMTNGDRALSVTPPETATGVPRNTGPAK